LLRGRTHDVAVVERGAGTRSRTLIADGLARAG
jgi:hypothetical protein